MGSISPGLEAKLGRPASRLGWEAGLVGRGTAECRGWEGAGSEGRERDRPDVEGVCKGT